MNCVSWYLPKEIPQSYEEEKMVKRIIVWGLLVSFSGIVAAGLTGCASSKYDQAYDKRKSQYERNQARKQREGSGY